NVSPAIAIHSSPYTTLFRSAVIKGRKKAANVKWAIVVPGSGLVKRQAEAEGLDRIFIEAGLEWREPGCSACLAMNPDKVPAGERSEEHTSELQSRENIV